MLEQRRRLPFVTFLYLKFVGGFGLALSATFFFAPGWVLRTFYSLPAPSSLEANLMAAYGAATLGLAMFAVHVKSSSKGALFAMFAFHAASLAVEFYHPLETWDLLNVVLTGFLMIWNIFAHYHQPRDF